jgi:Nitrile hydratase beta subunit
MNGRMHHDLGGLPAGKVQRSEHDYAEWERRVDAMVQLLRLRGRITVDELRKNIESLPPQDYDTMAYYEKWITSLTQTLIQRGVITTDELGRKMEEVENRCSRGP